MLVTIFLKKLKMSLHQFNSPPKMVLVQCVRLHLGIKTVSCRSVSTNDKIR